MHINTSVHDFENVWVKYENLNTLRIFVINYNYTIYHCYLVLGKWW